MDQSDQRVYRSLAFEKMEELVQEMQDPETGVPVRSQKQLFLTSIPSAFTGYDVIEWLMERLKVDDPVEAVNIANQLCHYGYFFPVSDAKNLVVKDDGSLYRFQIPYYWPSHQIKNPDNVDYAIFLVKRNLRNKQRHGLEDFEVEMLAQLRKNLANKWNFITIQAEEQVKLSKERKKGEKIVSDSQEKAYWRVHRPPPGYSTSLEPVPLRAGAPASIKKRRNSQDIKREIEFLKSCVNRTRTKISVALESLIQYSETYSEYDPMFTSVQPSNPWISDDVSFWHFNNSLVEIPTEKRVKRWALSMEELVSDPTGLQEFTNYLRKEYSHENIRFWMAANDLRRSGQSTIAKKVKQIYDEFLAPGAPCEINIDGRTLEKTHAEMKNATRFTFDAAAEHVYTLLLKKDCYPRFIRSEHYKNLLATGTQPTGKRKFGDFFGFGGVVPGRTKNPLSSKPIPCGLQTQQNHPSTSGTSTNISKRRGSDRSLSGSTHELSVQNRGVHSHSQSITIDNTARELNESVEKSGDEVCPWDYPEPPVRHRLQLFPSATDDSLTSDYGLFGVASTSRKNSTCLDSIPSSDVSIVADVTERLKKSCGLHETFSRFSRRSSSTANPKQTDSTRPSVSSTEDLTATPSRSFDSNHPNYNDKESGTAEEAIPIATTTRRRSLTCLINRKHSTTNATPLISVSSVSEQIEESVDTASSSCPTLVAIVPSNTTNTTSTTVATSDTNPEAGPSTSGEHVKLDLPLVVSTSSDQMTEKDTEKATPRPIGSPNDVCPWEDEENCKVKASNYIKFYETLGYL